MPLGPKSPRTQPSGLHLARKSVRLLKVKIFDHPQGERIRLQDLGLGLDDHVHFERVGWGVRGIRLDAQRAGGIFLQLDLADGLDIAGSTR